MREANWDEIFQKRREDGDDASDRIAAFLPWESWLTFIIAAIGFMSVVHSIDSADWVDDMPSLYPIGFSGLLIGYALSRVRRSNLLVYPAGLLAGATLVYLQLIAIVPGGTPLARTDHLVERMRTWWTAVTQDGISNDSLPFIVLMLTMVWLGAYFSAWAIFRWRNAWLGLVPGGIALMWNISFIPGQFSYSFIFFVFSAVLLLMRVHLANRESDWERRGVAYPEFLSLSVLNATFWVTVLLLVMARLVPLAERSDSANERWRDFTAPATERLAPLSRVFIGVNAKKPISVHNLEDALAFQGKISPSGRAALDIDVEITPEMAAFLRAQSFDEYTSDGWKVNVKDEVALNPGDQTNATDDDVSGTRKDVTVNVTVKGKSNDEFLYSVGQPVQSSAPAAANTGGAASDVNSLKPARDLDEGDQYSVTGSVSLATVDQLRAAGEDYPDWVRERYLQLPDDLPGRVDRKARDVVRSASSPYDQAVAIERYLRTFPQDFKVPSTPPGRDTVDYFLFDLQRGYFDYHASAMAVMLRTLGVPARVATGYALDPTYRDLNSPTYHLTEKSAFAWPEVYFPGIGWVEFSPTPSQPAIQRPGAPIESNGPREDFIDPSIAPEPPIDLGIDPADRDPNVEPVAASDGGSSAWPAIISLAVIGAAAALLFGGARFAWEFGLGGLSKPQQLWEKTARLAKWGRAGARADETPREFAARLRRDVPGADAAGYVAALYERSRFGNHEPDEDEAERLDAAWVTLRNALLRRALRFRHDR